MGQITRMHYGTAEIDVRLIGEIERVLDMDDAEPRAKVVAEREWLHSEAAADGHRNPWHHDDGGLVHDWWKVRDVDAVQRLRGWHRLRYGTVTVRAEDLSTVRNLLDALLLNGVATDCEELARQLGDHDDDVQEVNAIVEQGLDCGLCFSCRVLDLRDECDEALDANGYDGGVYYRAYIRRED